jgi:hypothetical protein
MENIIMESRLEILERTIATLIIRIDEQDKLIRSLLNSSVPSEIMTVEKCKTLKELRAYCVDNKIKGHSKYKTKQALITFIESIQAVSEITVVPETEITAHINTAVATENITFEIDESIYKHGFKTNRKPLQLDDKTPILSHEGKLYVEASRSCDGPNYKRFKPVDISKNIKFLAETLEGEGDDGDDDYKYYIISTNGTYTLNDLAQAVYNIYKLEGSKDARDEYGYCYEIDILKSDEGYMYILDSCNT